MIPVPPFAMTASHFLKISEEIHIGGPKLFFSIFAPCSARFTNILKATENINKD